MNPCWEVYVESYNPMCIHCSTCVGGYKHYDPQLAGMEGYLLFVEGPLIGAV